ncbi:MAG TPA: hypothetical protein DIC34_02740 [Treponema sp.]|nr:hypothetical protein [Treponema sp.]
MLVEDWYGAAEHFLEALRVNPSYVECVSSLAECYYSLGEFDQALSWARKARSLSRGSTAFANLEAFIRTAMGDLAGADAIIREVLSIEPNNREASFAAAELDIARGRAGDAAVRYREAARRYPDDRRALLSLALVLGSLGDEEGARSYAERAVALHADDHRVLFYAAYLDSAAGRLDSAAKRLEAALSLKGDFAVARSLLATVRYRRGEWEEAARLADAAIAADRSDVSAWYLKGLALERQKKYPEARAVLAGAVAVDGEDEFARATLENLIVATTRTEAPERARWAKYHFDRARDFLSRNLSDQAIYEYRRGLRLDPYAKERAAYAEIMRTLGYPAKQLAELRFMQELGKADRAINDAVETYDSLLADALHRRWDVDPVTLPSRHWNIAVVSIASQSAAIHADSGRVAAGLVKDLLVHDGNISVIDIGIPQPGFSAAFRAAREAGADYFLAVSAAESERDLSLHARLYVARTGSDAAEYAAFRTGSDRLRNSARRIVDQLSVSLPFRSTLVARKAGVGLMDKGKIDGVKAETVYEIIRKGAAAPLPEGIGLSYTRNDVVGTFTTTETDESISAGALARIGFFDRIAAGDEIVALPVKAGMAKDGSVQAAQAAQADGKPEEPVLDPELRYLLRTLR